MTKILITKEINDKYREKIKALGYDLEVLDREGTYDKEKIELALGAQALRHVDFKALPNLVGVFTKSMGVDYLPLDYFAEKGVKVCNNKGAYADPIGEFMVYGLLEMEKESHFFMKNQEEKTWKRPKSLGTLMGKTVLFYGTGSLAQAGAKRLLPFGLRLLGFRRQDKPQDPFHEIITQEGLEEALGQADYIIYALPHTEDTVHLLNKETLPLLKKGVKIVNVSRGDIIEEEALIQGLKEGIIGGAVLDVFEKEPLNQDSPLWDLDQVYITPHFSYSSERDEEISYGSIMENLRRYKEKAPLVHEVDTKRGY